MLRDFSLFCKKHLNFVSAFLLLSVLSGRADAASPFALTYSGLLVGADSQPLTATKVNLTFNFFNVATGGTALSSLTMEQTALNNGIFTVDLSLAPDAMQKAFVGDSQVWIETVDKDNNKTYPRQRFSAVPFALKVPVDGTTIKYNANGQLTGSGAGGDPSSILPTCKSERVVGAKPTLTNGNLIWDGRREYERKLTQNSEGTWICKLTSFSIKNYIAKSSATIPADVLRELCADDDGCQVQLFDRNSAVSPSTPANFSTNSWRRYLFFDPKNTLANPLDTTSKDGRYSLTGGDGAPQLSGNTFDEGERKYLDQTPGCLWSNVAYSTTETVANIGDNDLNFYLYNRSNDTAGTETPLVCGWVFRD
jgi:hypothetical protein